MIQTLPTTTARDANRRYQKELRQRRAETHERISVWLTRQDAADLRALADSAGVPIQAMLAHMIASATATRTGQMQLPL